jgi:hypothetical protein
VLIFLFTGSTCIAQSANTTNNKTKADAASSLVLNDAELKAMNADASNDATQGTSFQIDPNPTKGMITVKTECAGKVYFFSEKGKPKGACIVNEGNSEIFLETVLNPGTYTCKFEGVNGSTGTIKVVYKP